ncbi:TetR/AcrR family transcriptional regulator [Sutcliffiella rhizosphaerae]|uniref:HTH-type transcriptional regulator YfiR n=1 Tax=Sutcliffiella rhizosphaerae TaxID=2880967 RepID=A0ABN8A5L6_9BACI|nr:TetR/AcrR family transcriptional regulator [Sutcliffiella rhizosphaerae]CAG9619939.1 putative HTH-type transcriptional regulator YfiR [Sutcliffiella rhizosphaerae]
MPPAVTEEYKKKKKKQILESALFCFAEKGFQVATIDDIVRHSGISKGAIYNYFKSKEDIYIELLNENSNKSFEKLRDKLATFLTAKERLTHLFEVFRSQVKVNDNWEKTSRVHIEFWLSSNRNEDTKAFMYDRYQNVYKKIVTDIVEFGVMNGEISTTADVDFVGTIFWSTFDGICFYQCVMENDSLYVRLVDHLEKVMLDLLELQ